jgi:hypothetical protein
MLCLPMATMFLLWPSPKSPSQTLNGAKAQLAKIVAFVATFSFMVGMVTLAWTLHHVLVLPLVLGFAAMATISPNEAERAAARASLAIAQTKHEGQTAEGPSGKDSSRDASVP